jgi:DNA-binding response OmpR family regulator
MRSILLIEDEPDIQLMVQDLLGQRHKLVMASTAADAFKAIEANSIDLVLLDVGLPDGDGFQVFSRLRAAPRLLEVPIIFLTGNCAVNDRVAAFSLGADDYIVKPFEPLEFRARIEAKMAVRILKLQKRDIVRKGRLELDRAMFKAFVHEESGTLRDLELTPHEFRLLIHFITHEDHVLSRDQLMTAVWGDEIHVLERTIDRHVSTLRRKLDEKFEQLESVHGIGYRFSFLTPVISRFS